MLKYLIIPLSEDAVSFCHYGAKVSTATIDADLLRQALFWAMKENVMVQLVYPSRNLPQELLESIDMIDHTDIVPSDADEVLRRNAEIVVFDNWVSLKNYPYENWQAYAIRTTMKDLLDNPDTVRKLINKTNRLNVIITDIPGIPDKSIQEYKLFLESLIPEVVAEYIANHPVQLNILTDRIMLNEMNNCNSGDESLTLAPDGNFYLCPAFFNEGGNSVGDIDTGIKIKNPQLLKLSNAPICRNCDAYQCKRCIWLNQKLTREVNTPGREQCVVAHIERNASKKLLEELRKINAKYQAEIHIPEIDHLDPFELLKN